MMNDDFFPNRLAQLRTLKGCSARDMSLSLGQSESYINKIENRRTLPSIPVFYYICDYLKITPRDFFDEGNNCPEQIQELVEDLKKLDAKALTHIADVVKDILKS